MSTEEEAVKAAPNFVKPLKNIEAPEGQNIHLEARLHPTGDSTMRVEWTVNGKPMKSGIYIHYIMKNVFQYISDVCFLKIYNLRQPVNNKIEKIIANNLLNSFLM